MNLFRSEEHIERWLAGRTPGATIPAAKLCDARPRVVGHRLDPSWMPHTREENQAILERLGLVGGFWTLA